MITTRKERGNRRILVMAGALSLLLLLGKLGTMATPVNAAPATPSLQPMTVGRGRAVTSTSSAAAIPSTVAASVSTAAAATGGRKAKASAPMPADSTDFACFGNKTPPPLQAVAAVWTKGTAQPGDNGALLNVTINNPDATQIQDVRENLTFGGQAGNFLSGPNGDDSSVSFVGAPILAGLEGTATFALDVFNSNNRSSILEPLTVHDNVTYDDVNGDPCHWQMVDLDVYVTYPLPLTLLGTMWDAKAGTEAGVQGDQGDTLILELRNPNPFPVSTLGGTLVDGTSGLSSPDGGSTVAATPASSEVIPANSAGTLNFTVDVAPNAPLGFSPANFIVNYEDQWGASFTTKHSASVSVVGAGGVQLTSCSTDVTMGTPSSVSCTITNSGNASLLSPSFSINAGSPLIVVSTLTLPPSEEVSPIGTVTLDWVMSTSAGAQPGAYPGTLTFTYTDAFGYQHSATFSLDFTVFGSTKAALSVTTDENQVTIGQVSKVSFTVSNTGSATMYSPVFSLQVSSPLVISANSTFSSSADLAGSDSFTYIAELTAGPNVPVGTYPAELVVTYADEFGGQHNATFSVGLTVVGTTQTFIKVSTLDNLVLVGATSPVSFEISNVGSQPMYTPTVSLQVSSPLVIMVNSTISSSAMISSGGELIYNATLSTGPSAVGGAYSGSLVVTYADGFGASHSETFAVGFTVSGSTHTEVAVSTLSNAVSIGNTTMVSFLIDNIGTETMNSPTFSLDVSSPLVVTANSTYSWMSPISPNGSAVFEAQLTLGSSVAPGAYSGTLAVGYTDQFGVSYTQNFSVGFVVSGTTETQVSVTPGRNAVIVGGVSTVSFTIHNVGTVPMYSPTFTLEVTSPLVVVSNSTFSSGGEIVQSGNMTFDATLTAGPSAEGGDYAGTLTVTYDDGFGVPHAESFAVGFTVSGSTRSSLSVDTLANNLTVGATSTVSFRITNIGTQPMYSPTFTLTVQAPLVITANATVTSSATMAPGSSRVFSLQVTAGPKTSITAYSGVLEVDYTDQFGVAEPQNFTVGFLVLGTVHPVILDEHFVQNLDNVTITGTLLNDGTTSALYSNLTVSMSVAGGSATYVGSQYIGQVDPTTPVPFSVVIPYMSQDQPATATFTMSLAYQDNYRQSQVFNSTYQFPLNASSQLPQALALAHKEDHKKQMELFAGAGSAIGVAGIASFVILRRKNPLDL